jgi:hypothetical protein
MRVRGFRNKSRCKRLPEPLNCEPVVYQLVLRKLTLEEGMEKRGSWLVVAGMLGARSLLGL